MDTQVAIQPKNSTRASARIHYIDWLRVIAILMVFLFHAVHPFDFGDWQVKNVDQSEALTIILTFLSLWGMPFFFLVAGASSWFALLSRSPRKYISERFYRLLVPFFIGFILFSPIEYYCENINKIQRGVLTTYQSFSSTFLTFDPRLLRFPGFSPRWFGMGYHLWFLGFLFSFALITLPFFLWLKKERGQEFVSWLAGVCQRRGGLLLLIIPAAIIYCVLRPFVPEEHDWADFIFQMYFYAAGFILFSDQRFVGAIRRDWAILLAAGTLAIAGLVAAYLVDMPVFEWSEDPTVVAFYMINILWSVIAICFSLAMLYVGLRFLDFTNQWLVYGQEAALPFFVLHQPVIIVIAFFVVQLDAAVWIKLPVVVLSSFAVTLALYEWFVRRFRPLRLAFGMKSKGVDQIKPVGAIR